MSERLSSYLGAAIALVCALSLIAFAVHVTAQTTCPGGTVAITDATRAAATAAGLPASVGCWNPSDANTGQAAGDAKIWLEQHATKDSNISCLNAQFAERLMTFMQAVPGGVPVITYGYRTIAAQNAAIASGASRLSNACSGYHVYGLAADFNNTPAATLTWMRVNAPQYGLSPTGVNPQTGCASSGFCDPGHIQMAGPIPAGAQCGVCDSSQTGTLPNNTVQTPTSGITNAVQNIANPPPQNASYAQPSSVTPVSSVPTTQTPQAGACTPQYTCQNNSIYYESDSCSTSLFQTCQYGCSGTTCNPSPTATSTSSVTTTPTSPIITPAQPLSTTPISSSSPLSGLEQFFTPTNIATTAPATSSPLSLNSNIYTIVQGELATQTPDSMNTMDTTTIVSTGYEQTLTSGSADQYSSIPDTPLGQLLFNLQTALGGLLTYLRPFGGQIPALQQFTD